MRAILKLTCVVFAVTLLLSGSALAGGRGRRAANNDKLPSPYDAKIDFIVEHALELKLTEAQSAKLEQLRDMYGKYFQDPALHAILKDLRAARRQGNESDATAAGKRLAAKLKEKSSGILDGFQADVAKILSADQVKKFTELHAKDAAPADGAAPVAGAAPKLPPNPFEP